MVSGKAISIRSEPGSHNKPGDSSPSSIKRFRWRTGVADEAVAIDIEVVWVAIRAAYGCVKGLGIYPGGEIGAVEIAVAIPIVRSAWHVVTLAGNA